jgi:ankyrin repeat protein
MTLHDTARAGDVTALTHAIAAGGDVNAKDKLKRTPLHMAAWAGQAAAVALLLASGANAAVEATDGMTGALRRMPRCRRDAC